MVSLRRGSRGSRNDSSGLDSKTLEALVEAGELAAAVDQTLPPPGPRRMRFRVDVEEQRVARLAVSRARLVGGPIGQHDRDFVIVGVDTFFHRVTLGKRALIATHRRSRNSPQFSETR